MAIGKVILTHLQQIIYFLPYGHSSLLNTFRYSFYYSKWNFNYMCLIMQRNLV